MANHGPGFDWTFPVAADLSSKQFFLVAATTDGNGRVNASTARGQRCVGVNQGKSTAAGQSVRVRIQGVTKVEAGDSTAMANSILVGTPLMCSSNGTAVPTTNGVGDLLVGYALSALTSGSTGIITAYININGAASSA